MQSLIESLAKGCSVFKSNSPNSTEIRSCTQNSYNGNTEDTDNISLTESTIGSLFDDSSTVSSCNSVKSSRVRYQDIFCNKLKSSNIIQ